MASDAKDAKAETTSERRKVSRVVERMAVRTELHSNLANASTATGTAAITNFSEHGVFLESGQIYPPGAALTLHLELAGVDLSLSGRIIWWQMAPFDDPNQMHFGTGMALTAEVPAWNRHVAALRQLRLGEMAGREPAPRFEVKHRVRLGEGTRFLSEYAQNISRGGVYVSSQEPLPVGEVIKLELELPGEALPLELEAQVAYALSATAAERRGRPAGAGVQFVNFAGAAKERLHQYLRRLEIHRSRARRLDPKSIPQEGSLGEFSVPEVLLSIQSHRRDGVLTLERGVVVRRIHCQSGSPVFVEPPTVEDEVALGATELITNTFPWFDGRFSFAQASKLPASAVTSPLSVEELIFAGVAQWYDAEVVCAWTGLTREAMLSRVAAAPALKTDASQRLWQALATAKSIEQLMTDTLQRFEDILPTIYSAVVCGWLRVGEDGGAAEETRDEVTKVTNVNNLLELAAEPVAAAVELPEIVPEPLAELEELAAEPLVPDEPRSEVGASAVSELRSQPLVQAPATELPELAVQPEELPELFAEELAAEVEPLVAPVVVEAPAPALAVVPVAAPAEEPEWVETQAAPEPEVTRTDLRVPSLPSVSEADVASGKERQAQLMALRGKEMLEQGDVVGAFKQYSLAVAFDPNNQQFKNRVADLTPLANEAKAKKLADRAKDALAAGDYETAGKNYEQASAVVQTAGRFAHLAAEAYLDYGQDMAAALRMAEEAVGRAPRNALYRMTLAAILQKQGEKGRAKAESSKALELAPDDATLLKRAQKLKLV